MSPHGSERVHVTISHVINYGSRQFGFAMTDGGEEVFIPRSTVLLNHLTDDDVGGGAWFNVIENLSPIEGMRNLRHLIGVGDFDS